ncbi:MAG: hypothetical protein KC422_11240 [Trueperaceae bacterium]|nr:hypothetical protein [Trueperaceae bacterium]
MKLPAALQNPPPEFSIMPFWFWNDDLDKDELLHQIDEFEKHGVLGFVIHPRIGLPHDLGWMSERLLGFYELAIEEAAKREMKVLLYDEGMYPSGSSAGQVVAKNPDFACRGLAKIELANEELHLEEGQNLVAVVNRADGTRVAIIDRKVDSYIRGLHYAGEGPEEETFPAADLLNPEAVATFIELVYDGFAARFSQHFGKTLFAMFTDEPALLGRCRESDVHPGTTGILKHVNRILGYDFKPHLLSLWYDDEPDAERYRKDYYRAVQLRLEESYYQQLSNWCEHHDLPLTGHPEKGDDIGVLRYFHIPGQDLVWRWVLPDDPTALEGRESTQAKCSSSAALHYGRRRNSNECCGAYGHELSWDEMQWLARWCFVRGVNLLYPHAFYYSVRGPRWDERPPDVGMHSSWWNHYKDYADACRRLSWLNTDSEHICHIAILGKADYLPWRAAKVCFCQQLDFNYLEERDLLELAQIDEEGIHIAGMTYKALILEDDLDERLEPILSPLKEAGRLISYTPGTNDREFTTHLSTLVPEEITIKPESSALRVRHIKKQSTHWFILFNEEKNPLSLTINFALKGNRWLFDPVTAQIESLSDDQTLHFDTYELKVVAIEE